ncbi:glycosyltransferase [Acidobacteria bacterium ACD]|nr:MAG: glycosyltransferase [Acidobacteriota bacterium]MDL1948732.1 glycosyltransferase [Acidobacteria bacterium ACD]
MDRRLVLFAREPVAGRVKTRLALSIGAPAACRLYGAMLEDLAGQLPSPAEWQAVLAHDGAAPGPVLGRLFGTGWLAVPQGGGGLGERLVRVLDRSAAEGARATVVAGSDAPSLTAERVREAFRALGEGGARVALAPSPDGGYSLLGATREVPASALLGDVRWSTPDARGDTVAAARELGIPVALLDEVPDVDTREDLGRLAGILAEAGPGRRTRAVLAELERP